MPGVNSAFIDAPIRSYPLFLTSPIPPCLGSLGLNKNLKAKNEELLEELQKVLQQSPRENCRNCLQLQFRSVGELSPPTGQTQPFCAQRGSDSNGRLSQGNTPSRTLEPR